MSALPPKAVVNGYGAGCLLLTQSGHCGCAKAKAVTKPITINTRFINHLIYPSRSQGDQGRRNGMNLIVYGQDSLVPLSRFPRSL
jgi:hypothetical protein